MDIRNWSLDQIMQLPDHCFGRRWPIGLQVILDDAVAHFDISEFALPETTVIWGFSAAVVGSFAVTSINMGLALGDVLPIGETAWSQLELIFGGVVGRTQVRGSFHILSGNTIFIPMRQVVQTAGRRLVGRFIRVVGIASDASCQLIISSVPTEVPDCLLSVHP